MAVQGKQQNKQGAQTECDDEAGNADESNPGLWTGRGLCSCLCLPCLVDAWLGRQVIAIDVYLIEQTAVFEFVPHSDLSIWTFELEDFINMSLDTLNST